MDDLRLGTKEIVIRTRTIQIGYETYQTRNVTRVTGARLAPPPNDNNKKLALSILAAAATFLVVVLPIANNAGSAEVALQLIGLAGSAYLGYWIYKRTKQDYPTLYGLVLETSGFARTSLISPDWDLIAGLASTIVDTIEHPPTGERVIRVEKVVMGNEFNQWGSYNTQNLQPGRSAA